MYINKWVLYFIIVTILFLVFILPTLVFQMNSKETDGVVIELIYKQTSGRHPTTNIYPLFEYSVNGNTYRFLANQFIFEYPEWGLHAPVLYNPRNPERAYVNSFYGLWGDIFIWLLPTFLIITLSFLAINFIPTRIKIPHSKDMDEKLFE